MKLEPDGSEGAGPTDQTDTEAGDAPLITPLFVLIVGAGLFYFLAIGAMLPTLPIYVEAELGGGGVEVGLVIGAFAVSAALVRPTVGRLGDRWGRRRMSLVGSLLAAVAIAPLGLVEAVWFLVLLRLLAGLGEACFFIGAATAAQDLAPSNRRGEAASYFSIAIYGGLGFGPSIGEAIYDGIGTDATWLIAGASCAVAAAFSYFIPAELGRNAAPPPRNGLLHPAALLPGSVLLMGIIGFTGFASFLPLYIDDIGVEDAGPFFLVYGILVLCVRIFGARIPDRLGAVRTSSIALVSIASGVGCVAAMSTPAGAWIGTVLLALGMSLLFPALFTLVIDEAPDDERSHAVGSFGLFFDLSQGLGAPVLGVLVTVFGTERAAFVAGAVVALGGLVLANTRLRTSETARRARA